MNLLVTGGAGFIGSHLVEALLARGDRVVVVDDLSTGHRHNLADKAEFFEGTVEEIVTSEFLIEHGIELVFHQAAQIDIRRSIADPRRDARINIDEGLALLEACRTAGVTKLVFASTGGAIYGEPIAEELPISEERPPEPLSCYGISKLAFEHYLRLYGYLYGFEFVSLRYANVYGPRQDPNGEAGVVAIFLEKLTEGETPVIYGDGSQTRDYIYIADVVEANLVAAERLDGGVYNIGTGLDTSVAELLEMVGRALVHELDGFVPPQPERLQKRLGEIACIALDPSLAERRLDWRPRTTFADGLALTAKAFLAENKKDCQNG